MQLELHMLDCRYERLRVRNRAVERRLVGDIDEDGLKSPLVVVRADGGCHPYIVIDGYKRLRALRKAGQDIVECTIWDMTEVDALVHLHHLQRSRERSPLEDGLLVAMLVEEEGMSVTRAGRLLNRTASWASRRLGLVKELPDWLSRRVQDGELSCYVVTKYLLPLARANAEHAELLADHLSVMKLSSRQVAELYRVWKEADAEGRELLVRRPESALTASRLACNIPESPQIRGVLQQLEKASFLAWRASRELAVYPQLDRTAAQSAERLCERLRAALQSLDHQLRRDTYEAHRPGETSPHSSTA